MLKPEDMTYLDISIHRSRIPAFLNEVPKEKLHIVEFTESKEYVPHHLRREHQFRSDEEMMQHKIHEIEENIIYFFEKMKIDPEDVSIPEDDQKIVFAVKSIDDAIDLLHERTTNETRRLKGYFKELDLYKEKKNEKLLLKEILLKLQKYKPNTQVFTWFKQLEFHLFYQQSRKFVDMEVTLEHEEIPVIMEYYKIDGDNTVFFLIFHHSHHDKILEITSDAIEIEEIKQYYNEKSLNLDKIEKDLKFFQERIERAEQAIKETFNLKTKYRGYMEVLHNCKIFNKLEQQFRETYRNEIVRIEAFIPTSNEAQVLTALDSKFHNQIRIVAYPMTRENAFKFQKRKKDDNETYIGTESEDYEYSVDKYRLKKVKVPSLIETRKLFRPFRILTDLYGTTNYTELDPTSFVALTYPILFGMMFGDLGHGLILILTGLIITLLKRKNKKTKAYDAGFLLIWLGLFASIMGILYGEMFGHEIPGIEPVIGNPLHNVISVLKLAIFIGVVHVSLGWFLSMINHIQKREFYLAFADPFMKILILLAGAFVIFQYSFDITAWISVTSFPPYPILLPLFPALLLLILKPIGKLLGISYLKEDSVGELIGEQAIEVSETFMSILSNIASYSRLLALAMAHVGLMFMITEITELLSGKWFLIVVIMVIGNLFVILMESIIAGIHALRLTFYEFFGKFYLGNGVPYECTEIESNYSELEFINEKYSSKKTD